ncbi:hypothetical protein WJM97_01335 [Okeanomitos corallinicola TIOX110]|uniref:Bacteriocin n=1 Tax=Okeanomitos corallinicola TIOX110 TaxID=3133117 RepID=A0ABZ2UU36_9CYAN
MFNQIERFNFMELTTEEQQFISGGYGNSSPCCQPPRCCGCDSHEHSMPYKNFMYSYGY